MNISIVIPIRDEVGSLKILDAEIHAAMSSVEGVQYEVLYVDDHSRDGSQRVLLDIVSRRPEISKLLILKGHRGKARAMRLGFSEANGDYIVFMDGDLQNDPKDIEKMLEVCANTNGFVIGHRQFRIDTRSYILSSKFLTWYCKKISGMTLIDGGSPFRVFPKSLLKQSDFWWNSHRHLAAKVHWRGGEIIEVPINHRARQFGESKYSALGRIPGVLVQMPILLFLFVVFKL